MLVTVKAALLLWGGLAGAGDRCCAGPAVDVSTLTGKVMCGYQVT